MLVRAARVERADVVFIVLDWFGNKVDGVLERMGCCDGENKTGETGDFYMSSPFSAASKCRSQNGRW